MDFSGTRMQSCHLVGLRTQIHHSLLQSNFCSPASEDNDSCFRQSSTRSEYEEFTALIMVNNAGRCIV